ncbi:MAG: fimbrillin family protein [Rikenellaceae bacterium]
MNRTLLAILAIGVLASCNKEDSDTSDGNAEAVFTSSAISTRVSDDGTTWDAAESIGITMFNLSGTDNLTETLATGYDNVHYKSSNTEAASAVDFKVVLADSTILYPNTGSVKFYAYYPYQWTMSDGVTYLVDVSNQSANIDFMVATPVTATRATANNVLEFSHKLAKLTLTITCNDNVTDLTGVSASITGLSTKWSYDISAATQSTPSDNTTAINFIVASTTTVDSKVTQASATALIIPETLGGDATISFTLGTRTFSVKISSSTQFEAGKNHSYTVALGNDMPTFVSGSTIVGWDEPTGSTTLYSNPTN